MSVAYQSWEVASGPTVGYNMAAQGSICSAVAEGSMPNVPNYGVHGPQDSLIRGFFGGVEGSKGPSCPNHRVLAPQDTAIRGLSALSLYVQPADVPLEENKCMPLGKGHCTSSELNGCMSARGDESMSFVLASPSAGSMCEKDFGSYNSACDVAFIPHDAVHNLAHVTYSHESSTSDMASDLAIIPHRVGPSKAIISHSTARSRNSCTPMKSHSPDEDYGHGWLHGSRSPNYTLDVVAEDKPWEDCPAPLPDDLEPDSISSASASSVSFLNDMPLDSSTSGEGSQVSGDTEAQSAYKGPSEHSSSPGWSPPPRKGLSRFYAGKSRSFSCLGDVVSVKDLAKPEHPYARRRKYNLGSSGNLHRPRLPPLQKGAASISKKSLNNEKSTLVLAVAMSTKEGVLDIEEQGFQSSLGAQMWQRSPVPSRSYSLSDLQRASGSHFSHS